MGDRMSMNFIATKLHQMTSKYLSNKSRNLIILIIISGYHSDRIVSYLSVEEAGNMHHTAKCRNRPAKLIC